MRYTLFLLGPFAVQSAQHDDFQLSLERKTRTILAYLAATNEPQSRRFLWELFCQSANDPAGSLRWHLSRIRRELDEQILHITPQDVTFNTAVASTDLLEFQQTLGDPSQQTTADLVQALAFYRGPFLAGLDPKNMPEFDLWLLAERSRVQRLYERGAGDLIGRTIREQQYTQGIQLAQKLLQTNPLLESIHGQLIWLYAQTGQRESALKQFAHCQTLLQEELAVEPLAETVALVTAVKNNQPLPPITPSPSPRYGPSRAAKTEFIGRQAECQQLQTAWQTIQQSGKMTLLIEAVAGGGKTHLVEQFLQTLAPETQILIGNGYESTRALPYQSWLTILESWTGQLTAEELKQLTLPWKAQLARLLPHLFPVTTGAPEQQEHLFRAVAHLLLETKQSSKVIFLEDLHLADEASVQLLLFLTKYYGRITSPTFLIGTYRSEEVADNRALQTFLQDTGRDERVKRLELPPLTLDEIELLIRRLWLNRPLTENIEAIKVGLLAETGGNPLFLTELLRELGGTAVLPTPLPIPPSLQELINHRLQQMPENGRQVLETLAILERPIHFQLAQQISGRSEDETITAIELGLRWHFLQPHPAAQYKFSHDLIRNAIQHQLSDIRQQRLHFRAARTLRQQNTDTATLAYHWGMAGDQKQEAHYALLAAEKALSRAAFADALHLYQKAIDALPMAGDQERFQAELGVVKALDATSNIEKLSHHLTQLTALAETIGTPERQAEAATHQARFTLHQGNADTARFVAEQGLAWAIESENKEHEAELRWVIGETYQAQGDYAIAQTYAEQSLTQYQIIDDKRGQASVLGFLGNLHGHQGEHQQAVAIYRQALDLCRQLADPFAESRILPGLANALWQLGNHDEVKDVAERGLVVCRQIGDKKSEAMQLNNLAGVAMVKKDHRTAINYYRQALAIVEAENIPAGISVCHNNIGGAYVGLGDEQAALPHLQEAITVAQTAGLPREEAYAHFTTGYAYQGLGDFAAARTSFERALSLRQELGEQVRILWTLIPLTQTCVDLGDYQTAESYFVAAQSAYESLHNQLPIFTHQDFHFAAFNFYTAVNNLSEAQKSLAQANSALQNRLSELDDAERERLLQHPDTQAILNATTKLADNPEA